MKRRARLVSYSRWQAADFLVERLPGIAVITAAFGALAWLTTGALIRRQLAAGDADALRYSLLIFTNVIGTIWAPVAIVAANQVVSGDRASGRFRLLFAKPVSMRRYYLQAYVVNGALYLTAMAALLAPIASFLHTPWSVYGRSLAILAAGYLALGGVCFLFSALTRLDWFAAMTLAFTEIVLHHEFGEERWTRVLPPFHFLTSQVEALRDGRATDWRELGILALMGIVAVALGIWILRRRPLAT